MTDCVLVADLGGTKIRSAVFVGEESHFVTDRPTDISAGRDSVLAALCTALEECRAQAVDQGWSPVGVGLSCAGVIDPQAGVVVDASEAIPGWKGTRLAETLEAQFGLPVAAENDVKAALLGELLLSPEYRDGNTVMITLGTGLGGAISVSGDILPGASFVAGHFGQMRLPSPWQCGKTIALEHLVSGTGLANIANHLMGSRYFENGREVLSALRRGEAPGGAARDRFCEYLALALENIYWSLNPDRVLIGGGLVSAREDWWSVLESKLEATGLLLQIQPAKLGNDAGIHGAAALIRHKVGGA